MKVVNLRKESYTHYIGRPRQGQQIGLGNPYSLTTWHDRGTVIKMFEEYAGQDSHVLALIKALPGDAILGCFCKPKDCHGDVIVKLWKELQGFTSTDLKRPKPKIITRIGKSPLTKLYKTAKFMKEWAKELKKAGSK